MAKGYEVAFVIGAKVASSFNKSFGVAHKAIAGVGKAAATSITIGAVAAGAAMLKLGKEVIASFGELEQNLGGSEAVFGQYAKTIQRSGEDAYKNLGISQSDYLATANKMGALFQGSGLEQQKSLNLTEKAMQRAADMASVMGIDQSVALEAVTGAAKGTYAMMDNIGVKMDATSIQAFALSKGLDFAWASASNSEKAEVAMQMFFEKTEQYAGNFAKESMETISGSIGLLKASSQSLLAGLGNKDADIGNLSKNVADAFGAVIKNITPVIKNLAKTLPTVLKSVFKEIPGLLTGVVKEILPPNLASGVDWFIGRFNKLSNIIQNFAAKIDFSKVQSGFSNMIKIAKPVLDIVSKIDNAYIGMLSGEITLGNGARTILESMGITPETINTILSFAESMKSNFMSISKDVSPVFTTIKDAVISMMPTLQSMAGFVVQNVLPMLQSMGDFVTTYIIPPFAKFAEEVIPKLANTFTNLWTIVQPQIQGFIDAFKLIWTVAQPILGAFIDTVMAFASGIFGALDGIIQFIANVFTGNWTAAWEGLKNMFSSIMGAMAEIGNAPIRAIITLLNKAISGLNTIKIPDWVPPPLGGMGINIPQIPMLAKGGVVTSPTVAMIGEGNESEAVLPLSKLQSLLNTPMGYATNILKDIANMAMPTTSPAPIFAPNINFNGPADESSVTEVMRMTFEEFKAYAKQYESEKQRKGLDKK